MAEKQTAAQAMSVAELEEQLQRARAEEAKIKEATQREEALAAKNVEVEQVNGYAERLCADLIAAGVAASVRKGSVGQFGGVVLPRLLIDGSAVGAEMDTRRQGYDGRSYQFTIGNYGNRKIYPLLKDGTFNYAKIVEDIKERVEFEKRSREHAQVREEKRNASVEIVTRLRAEFDLPEYSIVRACDSDAEKVQIEIKTLMTEDHARALLQVMKSAGLIPSQGGNY